MRAPTTAPSSQPRSPQYRRSGRDVLGADDCKALDDLYAQLIWVPDGENEPLSQWAQRYRDIIGPPDSPRNARGGGDGHESAVGQPGAGGDPGDANGAGRVGTGEGRRRRPP